MSNPIRTSLDEVLLAVQAQLVARLAWPAERVLLVDPADLDGHPHGDQYLCLWPDLEQTALFVGAGRLDTRETVRVLVTLRTRKALDEVTSARLWLTDPVDGASTDNFGHLKFRTKVFDALTGFIPTDDATDQGNWLVDRPLAPRSATRPGRGRPDREWGESTIGFDLTYILDLNQDYLP